MICANKKENYHNNTTRKKPEFHVTYRDRVYNIQSFLKYHPGGKNKLVHFKDQILDDKLAKYPHSKSAYYLLEEFAVQHQERYNECEDLVNWDAPMLRQVGFMGDRYWKWVNLPVNRPIRFFQSDILELLSITPWYIMPIVWFPIAIYFLYMGCVPHTSTNIASKKKLFAIYDIKLLHILVIALQRILPSFVLGIFIWTIMEYFVHRKIFHLRPSHNSRLLITLHFLFHGNHHKAPLDERRLVFPPTLSLIIAAIIWQIYKAIFPLTIVNFVGAGTITGYLCYDLMHYYLHNGAPKAESYFYTMKRRHNYHHFLHHNQGFGVTSELWDHLMKTDLNLRKLDEPLEW
ncbi:Fatty acid 2-hydroxylase [Camponotus floridanus]|uniref:Fatty acid 2-hydroxylase n=1 Tax=Camponotus floridanus TaxID=104421 RepID=E2AVR8_CAMFO|nr:Fatty acid 2-hydroxylase [Camponotus floridanus]